MCCSRLLLPANEVAEGNVFRSVCLSFCPSMDGVVQCATREHGLFDWESGRLAFDDSQIVLITYQYLVNISGNFDIISTIKLSVTTLRRAQICQSFQKHTYFRVFPQ